MADNDYSAKHLSVLEGLDAVRKRPGMYIGSTDSRGFMHCLWEIIDNSVDEALAGHCNKITITLHADDSIEVQDNGRGIPVDVEKKSGLTGVELVMTKLHAGGKFDDANYQAAGGLHGVGASVVNALSARLDITVARHSKLQRMQFKRGVPGTFADLAGDLSPDAVFTQAKRAGSKQPAPLELIGKVKPRETGTQIRFWLDRSIFPTSSTLLYDELITRVQQTAYLLPGLTFEINDYRPERDEHEQPKHREFSSTGGIVDFVNSISHGDGITDVIRVKGEGEFTETIQKLGADGHLKPEETLRTCKIDIALRYNSNYETDVRYFTNIIANPKGGSHQAGFEQGLLKAVRGAVINNARKLKLSKKDVDDLKVEKDDTLTGLTAIVLVRLKEPQFEGQTKEILGTAPVRKIVSDIVYDQMTEVLEGKRRGFKLQAVQVLQKIVSEMQLRVNAKKQKEITRRKNALETSSMPAKLADCRTNEVERTELFIVEGDSALGTAKLARDSEFQALLPIRGKILNVEKASMSQILANAEISSIIQVIGAGSGRTFNIDDARYSKVVIMTDADVDGAHIRTLLLTLFYRYMQDMVKSGRVYAAMPPLHRIELSGAKRGDDKYIYTYTEEELLQKLASLRKQGIRHKEDIQRYKGLGEMDADQLSETTMNPAKRTLRRVMFSDAEKANAIFELLMGDLVPPRKEFIIRGSKMLDRALIDA
ncbi:MAG: type IIA DNA topoisomerase subunit B [Bifidobacteriaceae bacterium]|nr:type IIA DNA topoisomerase subunit B [Bifidobacteriaceae bacterium]